MREKTESFVWGAREKKTENQKTGEGASAKTKKKKKKKKKKHAQK